MRRHIRRSAAELASFRQLITPVELIIYKEVRATAFYLSVADVWESATKTEPDSVLHSAGILAADACEFDVSKSKFALNRSRRAVRINNRCREPFPTQIAYLINLPMPLNLLICTVGVVTSPGQIRH